MRATLLPLGATILILIGSTGALGQGAEPKTYFKLPTSTGPFIPKYPRPFQPLDKPRVDCGGYYVEGTPIKVNGKKGWLFKCKD